LVKGAQSDQRIHSGRVEGNGFTEAVLGGLGLTSADLESGKIEKCLHAAGSCIDCLLHFDKSGGQIVLGRQIVGQATWN